MENSFAICVCVACSQPHSARKHHAHSTDAHTKYAHTAKKCRTLSHYTLHSLSLVANWLPAAEKHSQREKRYLRTQHTHTHIKHPSIHTHTQTRAIRSRNMTPYSVWRPPRRTHTHTFHAHVKIYIKAQFTQRAQTQQTYAHARGRLSDTRCARSAQTHHPSHTPKKSIHTSWTLHASQNRIVILPKQHSSSKKCARTPHTTLTLLAAQ